jgi:AcrR family transcriptional regulator
MRGDPTQPHPRSTARTRRPRGSLGPEVILDAAEAIARDGFGAVTMRAVAARLGAAPMALYNHFATKEELVAALLDRVLGRFEPAPPTADWPADVRAFARAHRRLLSDHPWAVAPLFAQPEPGVRAVRIGEIALAILRRGGLSTPDAVAAFSGIVALNYGWASFTTARDLAPAGPSQEVVATLAALPPDAFPLTLEAAGELASYGSDRHYDFVLDRLVAGLPGAIAPGPA